ncbi:ATP-binding protein [Streptomyces fradiae]|uniref:ATP-binding protein n=1 Tax=Streptomyces fradiae TaxID=1906 RepID=UPI0035180602
MEGAGPWRRHRPPAAAVEHALPRVERHVTSTRVGPGAVREATRAVRDSLAGVGVDPRSALADAVLLVLGELVANVLRHARQTTVMDIGVTAAPGRLVLSVADGDPRLPELAPARTGDGLRSVIEVAALYDGELSAEPAVNHHGKIVMVSFCRVPGTATTTTTSEE